MCRYSVLCFLLIATVVYGDEPPKTVDYVSQIKPILKSRCYACHGVLKQNAKLRLETAKLIRKGGRHGPAIISGQPEKSLLVERITAKEAEERMPPEGKPLTSKEISLLKQWIAQGAKAPDEPVPVHPREHWAFRPIVRPKVPSVKNTRWVKNPIDAFIGEHHEKFDLQPQGEAQRVVLLRRLYLDLTGLPPTDKEINDFLADKSSNAYEKVVDRLLASPQHGERWARHWMDIWRYSDWYGFSGQLRNSQKHIRHWRDWIVESLNDNTAYDEMVRQMLAADELYPNDPKKLRATGYLARNFVLFNRDQWMDDVVEHVGKGFLGLTTNCAKCHDHKYDPISQHDYYAMRAFFEPYYVRMDVVPGQPDVAVDGIPRAFDGKLDVPTYFYIRGDESRPDKSKVITPGIPELLAFDKLNIKPVSLPVEAWQPERRSWVIDTHWNIARKKVLAAQKSVLVNKNGNEKLSDKEQAKRKVADAALALAQAELESVERRADAMRAAWKGDKKITGIIKEAGSKIATEKARAAVQAERQLAVARAKKSLADAELALLTATAKQKKTAEANLKKVRPSLDQAIKAAKNPVRDSDRYTTFSGAKWTATRFRESRTDDPYIHFLPKSTGRRTALANWITDSRNPLTARVAVNHIWTRHMGTPLVANVFDFGLNAKAPTHPELLDWLAAEFIESGWNMKHVHRLIVTSATYKMSSSTVGAKANLAKDPNNVHWWRQTPIRLESQAVRDMILAHAGTLDHKMGGPPVPVNQQAKSARRSLYFFHSDTDRNRFLDTFDEADVKECYRRQESIVPQQALAMSNSQLVLDAAPKIATRLSQGIKGEDEFIRKAFLVLLGITANDAEMSACRKALQAWRKLPKSTPDQARAQLIWALLNHNDFITLR